MKVKISKIRKFNYFLSIGPPPPFGKNCSLAPGHVSSPTTHHLTTSIPPNEDSLLALVTLPSEPVPKG